MPALSGPTPGLSSLAPAYPAVLSDVWGVVHNGVTPHWSAVEALVAYRAQGGRVVLIDTGMLTSVYNGRPSALELTPGRATALYADSEEPLPTPVER